jgi:hypothetical protein
MSTLHAQPLAGKASFAEVVAPFLDQPGLPFADVLRAEDIEQAFARHGGLFAADEIFSTPVVLWAFLAQCLRDGKGAACMAAVADITAYQEQLGRRVPSGDTGDYCRARAKLDLEALRTLSGQVAQRLDRAAPPEWLWHGRHAKLVDGFTFTMPDTPDNQEAFPQMRSQTPGVGFPIARACAVLSLSTAAIHDLAIGPYEGKETGETALLRSVLDRVRPHDVIVFDRCFCSYMMLAQLMLAGVDVCVRLHQRRDNALARGRQLGPNDCLITWTRPERPDWMSPEMYEKIPPTLTLRELRFDVTEPGRTQTITVITTLIDPVAYPPRDIADLYGYRWNVELDIRSIKQMLGLDHVRCKSPDMVRRELWVTILAYNLIRKVIATAAAMHDRQPRQIGFTGACQSILSSWMLLSTGAVRDQRSLWTSTLEHIAANEVANRPGRIEPRVLKRRRHRYPLMRRPRHELRKRLAIT